MKYVSTRGQGPALDFEEVLLAGLARDGGLYLPENWPTFSADEIASFAQLSYAELAVRIIHPFVGDTISQADLLVMATRAYGTFDHKAVTPLSQLGPNEFLLELYHGPTLAFKDLAMQMLGQLFDHVLTKRGEKLTIVGATSGDTGGAAIEAMRGRAAVTTYILHPKGRVSDVQRRMMTTVPDANVHNIAIEGTFDDCQTIVKGLFNDHAFRDKVSMGGVNSINWARIMAQTVYYFAAGVALGSPHRPISFAVPTGNFGDIFAGYVAGQMGLPIDRLIIGTNVNDILARTLASGEYRLNEVIATSSPSMDIQISSNFERLIFELSDRDAGTVNALMGSLAQSGSFTLPADTLQRLQSGFTAVKIDETEVAETIKTVLHQTGQLIDPHTAVGVAAGRKAHDAASPLVALSTAHPAKFPDAVEAMSEVRPGLPSHLSDLFERPELFTVLPNDLQAVRTHIEESLSQT